MEHQFVGRTILKTCPGYGVTKFKAKVTLASADVYIITVPTPFVSQEGDNIPTPEIKFVIEAFLQTYIDMKKLF